MGERREDSERNERYTNVSVEEKSEAVTKLCTDELAVCLSASYAKYTGYIERMSERLNCPEYRDQID